MTQRTFSAWPAVESPEKSHFHSSFLFHYSSLSAATITVELLWLNPIFFSASIKLGHLCFNYLIRFSWNLYVSYLAIGGRMADGYTRAKFSSLASHTAVVSIIFFTTISTSFTRWLRKCDWRIRGCHKAGRRKLKKIQTRCDRSEYFPLPLFSFMSIA